MVWKSWGWSGCLLAVVAVLLVASPCSGAGGLAVSLSEAPRRVSKSASAVFAFRVLQSSGVPCVDCAVTCKLDGGRASECGSSGNGNGTGTLSYAGLKDGNHTFAVCAGRGGAAGGACVTYAWNVDTVPPTASVTAGSAFTSASNVSALISFSEPCPGAGGFTCNQTYCNLIVYGPGRVEPSTLKVLRPGLRYSVAVTISPDEQYGRLILVMDRAFCTDAAGHWFTRTSNSSFTLRFDRRNNSVNITTSIPEKLLQIQGAMRLVQATNDAKDLRIYLTFAQPVLNSSAQILSVLKATDAVLTPTNRSTLGNHRFGYLVNKVSDTSIVTVSCDTSSIISRQGTPVYSAEPFAFLYEWKHEAEYSLLLHDRLALIDTQRPSVKLGTSTWRTSSHAIQVLIKFAKPVFNFSSSAVQLSGGNLFHEASKSIYTLQIQAVDKLVSVQVAENAAQDVAGNPNLASDRLEVRHYSVPASSSSIATLTTVVFVVTVVVATLLTVSTSSLLASGAISRPSSYMTSEPSRNLLRMACHIQIFALSRWLSVNLPIEYYEFAKGIEWTIPYMHLPWEGPAADPFLGYSTMPAIAYSELLDRSAVGADISYPPQAKGQQVMPMQMPILPTEIPPADGKPLMPMEIPGDGKPVMPTQISPGDGKPVVPMQIPLDGKPLTAMEYRSFFENPDMKPEAQIIMKLQDLDGWKYFGRNMFWLGVIGGGMILAHALTLLYLKLRYKHKEQGKGYGALVLPRFEIMVVVLATPCIAQAAAALFRGGTTGGLVVGMVLAGVLTSLLVGLFLFLSLGVATGRLAQYKEVHREGREFHWYQAVVRHTLGPVSRGQWTWNKDPRQAHGVRQLACRLGPLFEDLRGPPKYMLTQIGGGGGTSTTATKGRRDEEDRVMASEDENESAEAPRAQRLLGALRVHFTFLEWAKRVAVGVAAGAGAHGHASSSSLPWSVAAVLAVAAFQLLFMLLAKPFIRKRVQLAELLSVAGEVFIFAACLALVVSKGSAEDQRGVGLAMLGAFLLGFAAQACNEWGALVRQVRLLSADRSSFVGGAKAAAAGLLMLVLPASCYCSSALLGDRMDDGDGRRQEQTTTPPPPRDGGGESTAEERGSSNGNNNERWWLRQLREMAKASFTKEEDQEAANHREASSSSGGGIRRKKSGEWKARSRALYNDLEAIFSNR
ncbi:hypothetical protein EJB05_36290 [Eragrostis curvula]|uniref:Bacterial Ig-like domain-containing protein n=1 Tax=Eragrostis curvula TaxID=38414 RepID=A0A5J9U9T6_9POAL|nr:hypothetical protein EJB05_36290 [Eragrostis curvula]